MKAMSSAEKANRALAAVIAENAALEQQLNENAKAIRAAMKFITVLEHDLTVYRCALNSRLGCGGTP